MPPATRAKRAIEEAPKPKLAKESTAAIKLLAAACSEPPRSPTELIHTKETKSKSGSTMHTLKCASTMTWNLPV